MPKQNHFIWSSKMHLGIIKITSNRTAVHFMDERFLKLGDSAVTESQARACACSRESHLQTHTNFITVCHATPFPSQASLRTLFTVLLTIILKAQTCHYGKERYISDSCLWCSANHNTPCQLANQRRLRLSEGGAFERGGACM